MARPGSVRLGRPPRVRSQGSYFLIVYKNILTGGAIPCRPSGTGAMPDRIRNLASARNTHRFWVFLRFLPESGGKSWTFRFQMLTLGGLARLMFPKLSSIVETLIGNLS